MAVSNKISELQIEYQLEIPVSTYPAKPFLKWAGGKGQLIPALRELFPAELSKGQLKKYAEPFIGGGAVFFHIAQNYPQIESFYISDINQELVLAYQTIRKDVNSLISQLAEIEKEYHALSHDEQKTFFYKIRSEFNKNLNFINFDSFSSQWVNRTAQIIFLNRTCFNGLFRVNAKGEFNVPFGDYKNPRICDEVNLSAVSHVLQNTEIVRDNFLASKEFIDDETFVYFDPPYRPISQTASFTSYSKFEFGDDSQKQLAEYFSFMSERGAKLMLSNSDPKNENPDDHFFDDLYNAYTIRRIDANRMINSKAEKRGKITELVITNY